MDILGSALTNPTVSWTFAPTETPKKGRKVVRETEEAVPDGPVIVKSSNSRPSLPARLKKLIIKRLSGGDPSEREPLINSASRPSNKADTALITREKLKAAGKRFRKALHRSIFYLAAGVENMSSPVWISSTVPNPAYYYNRNHYSYNYETPCY